MVAHDDRPQPQLLFRPWGPRMTVTTLSATLEKVGAQIRFPSREEVTEKAAANGSVVLYQPYIGEAQQQILNPEAIPFDISFNTAPDTREYELFAILHGFHNRIGFDERAFWGLISPRFEWKAARPFTYFLAEAQRAQAEGFDCYAFNPMIGNAAIYANVWEQGGHEGMDKIVTFLGEAGLPMDGLQGASRFFFCNYVCGNQRFWNGYFDFCEKVLGALEEQLAHGTPAGLAYGGSGHYSKDATAKMRPFVIERLLGVYFEIAAPQGLKVAHYTPTQADFEWKFGPRVGRTLRKLLAWKDVFLGLNDPAAFENWQSGRLPIAREPHFVIFGDDPPGWFERTGSAKD